MATFICISGKAQNGKDTTATFLEKELKSAGKTVRIAHYATLLKDICKEWLDWDGEKDDYGRTLLQQVGTGIRRKSPNFWVDFIIKVVELLEYVGKSWDYIVIPDTRFPNEIERIKKSGYPVKHIRVVRKDFQSPLSLEQQNHISETALDKELPDILLINDGTPEQLREKVRSLVKKL